MKKNHFPMITGLSRLVFILGKSLRHSLSPPMQNAAFLKAGLPWVYVPLEIPEKDLGYLARILKDSNVQGANVTVPYKEKMIPWLDEVEADARWLGSVNTLYRKSGKLCGASTDGEGFLRSLGSLRRKLSGSKGLILGAGGAAKAVAGALARSGVKVLYVSNRSLPRAEQLTQALRKKYPRLEAPVVSNREAQSLLADCDWIVQGTSLGLHSADPSPLSLKKTKPGIWAVDLIYHRETAFLKEAKKRRLSPMSGIGMLLHQGALSFERWTGKKAPLQVMRRALLEHLQ